VLLPDVPHDRIERRLVIYERRLSFPLVPGNRFIFTVQYVSFSGSHRGTFTSLEDFSDGNQTRKKDTR
jgi:hypothetical protein